MKLGFTISFITIVTFVFYSCHVNDGKAQQRPQEENKIVGKALHITIDSFRILVVEYLYKWENDTSGISSLEYIDMVRIYNTLSIHDKYLDEKNCNDFYTIFKKEIIHRAIKVLDASIHKGMCYYSKEYDVYIGCKPHSNSQYAISSE